MTHDVQPTISKGGSNDPQQPPTATVNSFLYLDLATSDEEPAGRLVIRLLAPIRSDVLGKWLSGFRGEVLDVTTGTGGIRIYCGSQVPGGGIILPEEAAGGGLDRRHDRPGLLSADRTGSALVITTSNCASLDGTGHVVVGEVVKGLGIVNEVSRALVALPLLKVADCGQMRRDDDPDACEEDGFPFHPDDIDMDWYLVGNFERALGMADEIKSFGNSLFRVKNSVAARRKYRKALRYIHHLREAMGTTR